MNLEQWCARAGGSNRGNSGGGRGRSASGLALIGKTRYQQRLDQIFRESPCCEQGRPPPGFSHRIFESSGQRSQETSGDRLLSDAVVGKTDRTIGNILRKGPRR